MGRKLNHSMPTRAIAFWGCGGQSKVLKELLVDTDYRLVALFSDEEDSDQDVPVITGNKNVKLWVEQLDCPISFAIAIGGAAASARLTKLSYLEHLGLEPATLVHRTATLLSSDYGVGCQFLANSTFGVAASAGRGVILNTNSSVDHESQLGDGCHIGPGAVLAGRVKVGNRTFVGANATILPDVSIVEDCIIGAGAVVNCNITVAGTYVGVPARRLFKVL